MGSTGAGRHGVPGRRVVRVTVGVVEQRREQLGQPGPAPRAARLHGADGAVEDRAPPRRPGSPPCRRAPARRAAPRAGCAARRAPARAARSRPAWSAGSAVSSVAERSEPAVAVLLEVVGQRLGPTYLRGAQAVEAGVDDDPVQPGRHRRVAAERPGPSVRRDQPVLQTVGGVLPVAHGAQRDRPQPVAVPGEQQPERVGVAGDVGGEQRRRRSSSSAGSSLIRGPSPRRPRRGSRRRWPARRSARPSGSGPAVGLVELDPVASASTVAVATGVRPSTRGGRGVGQEERQPGRAAEDGDVDGASRCGRRRGRGPDRRRTSGRRGRSSACSPSCARRWPCRRRRRAAASSGFSSGGAPCGSKSVARHAGDRVGGRGDRRLARRRRRDGPSSSGTAPSGVRPRPRL